MAAYSSVDTTPAVSRGGASVRGRRSAEEEKAGEGKRFNGVWPVSVSVTRELGPSLYLRCE